MGDASFFPCHPVTMLATLSGGPQAAGPYLDDGGIYRKRWLGPRSLGKVLLVYITLALVDGIASRTNAARSI